MNPPPVSSVKFVDQTRVDMTAFAWATLANAILICPKDEVFLSLEASWKSVEFEWNKLNFNECSLEWKHGKTVYGTHGKKKLVPLQGKG